MDKIAGRVASRFISKEKTKTSKKELLKILKIDESHPFAKTFDVIRDGEAIEYKWGSSSGSMRVHQPPWDTFDKLVVLLKNNLHDMEKAMAKDSPTGLGMNRVKRKNLIENLKSKNRGMMPLNGRVEWATFGGDKALTTWRTDLKVEYNQYISDQIAYWLDNHLYHEDEGRFLEKGNAFVTLRVRDRSNDIAGRMTIETDSRD